MVAIAVKGIAGLLGLHQVSNSTRSRRLAGQPGVVAFSLSVLALSASYEGILGNALLNI